jgi:hypothetical protein
MYLLGTTLIIAGLASALLATAGYALTPRGHLAGLAFGRVGVRMTLVAVLAVVALLNYLFIAQRYDFDYERACGVASVVAKDQGGGMSLYVVQELVGSPLFVDKFHICNLFAQMLFLFNLQKAWVKEAFMVFGHGHSPAKG